jgi:protein required for attachment to host cells
MKKDQVTWMGVCEGARACVFRLETAPRAWVFVKAFEHPASRAHVSELVTDRPGRSQTRLRGTYGSGLERTLPHRTELRRFAHELATYLNDGARVRAFDRLVLVAPPKLLGMLREELSPTAQACVTRELAHDYTKLDARELDEHLRHAGAA